MAFDRNIKLHKINRAFNINVRLYYNGDSYNRPSDVIPRFYLEPVKLNYVEKTAFTEKGGKEKGFIKLANRQWGGVHETDLTDEQIESIYSQIKYSYPYGWVVGNKASEKKYLMDFKFNEGYQAHLNNYWLDHQDQIIEPSKDHLGRVLAPYPYIEIKGIDEIVKYKYTEGVIPEVVNDTHYDEWAATTLMDVVAIDPVTNCAPNAINVSISQYQGQNVFAWTAEQGILEKPIFAIKTGENYAFNMIGPWEGHHPFRFSEQYDGVHNTGIGYTGQEYTVGVTKNTVVAAEGYSGYNVELAVTTGTPSPLFYYCDNHSEMGGWIWVDNRCDPTLGGLPHIQTSLTAGVSAGATYLPVMNTYGFYVGNQITIDPGQWNEETATVAGFGSLILAEPLQYEHNANAIIESPNRGTPYTSPTPTTIWNESYTSTPTYSATIWGMGETTTLTPSWPTATETPTSTYPVTPTHTSGPYVTETYVQSTHSVTPTYTTTPETPTATILTLTPSWPTATATNQTPTAVTPTMTETAGQPTPISSQTPTFISVTCTPSPVTPTAFTQTPTGPTPSGPTQTASLTHTLFTQTPTYETPTEYPSETETPTPTPTGFTQTLTPSAHTATAQTATPTITESNAGQTPTPTMTPTTETTTQTPETPELYTPTVTDFSAGGPETPTVSYDPFTPTPTPTPEATPDVTMDTVTNTPTST